MIIAQLPAAFHTSHGTALPKCERQDDRSYLSYAAAAIFRDSDEAGTEIISIMFAMKNESDRTGTKNKNFLKELDRDRTEKGLEYAILVSLLEPDNELYNAGIVDVFHRFPKMNVIRPQFFLPMITLLRNAANKPSDGLRRATVQLRGLRRGCK